MTRRARIAAIAAAVFLFLATSALLTRALAGRGAERAAVLDVLREQAEGDAEGALAAMPACRAEPACAEVTRRRVAALRRPGEVTLLTYEPSIGVTLTRQAGVGRVAWRAGAPTARPVVQCVRVVRDGPLDGAGATLLSLSAPIRGDASCPA